MQPPQFSEHMNLYQLKCCSLWSNHLHNYNPFMFMHHPRNKASGSPQSAVLPQGRYSLKAIVKELPMTPHRCHKLSSQCCCKQLEFQYTCTSQLWQPSILLDYTFFPLFCFPSYSLCYRLWKAIRQMHKTPHTSTLTLSQPSSWITRLM